MNTPHTLVPYDPATLRFGSHIPKTNLFENCIKMPVIISTDFHSFCSPGKLFTRSNELLVVKETERPKGVVYNDGERLFVNIYGMKQLDRKTFDIIIKRANSKRIKGTPKKWSFISKALKSQGIKCPNTSRVFLLGDFLSLLAQNKIPKYLVKYAKDIQAYYDRKIFEDNLHQTISQSVSELTGDPNITAAVLKDAYQKSSLMCYGLDANRKGEPIKSLCDTLDRAILFKLLTEQQKGHLIQVTNDINKHMHECMSRFRRHGAKIKIEQSADKIKSLQKESFDNYMVPIVHGQTLQTWLDRDDIEFYTQKGVPRGGHRPKQRDPIKFLKEGNAGVYEKALQPLWSLRALMEVSTVEEFITFLVQTAAGRLWIEYYICLRVQMLNRCSFKKKAMPNAKLIGAAVWRFIDTRVALLSQLDGLNKAIEISCIFPALLAVWFYPRDAEYATVKFLSVVDFDIIESSKIPELRTGIFFIKVYNGYRIIKREFKTGRVVDNIDIRSPFRSDLYPHLQELVPQLFDAFEIFTGYKIDHNTSSHRFTFTNCQGTGIHRDKYLLVRNHSFPMYQRECKKGGRGCKYGCISMIQPMVHAVPTAVYSNVSADQIVEPKKDMFFDREGKPKAFTKNTVKDIEQYLSKKKVVLTSGTVDMHTNCMVQTRVNQGHRSMLSPFLNPSSRRQQVTRFLKPCFAYLNASFRTLVTTGKLAIGDTWVYLSSSKRKALSIYADYELDVRMIGRKHNSHYQLNVSKKLVQLGIPAINAEESLEQMRIQKQGDHSISVIEKHYCATKGELKEFAILSENSIYTTDEARIKRIGSYKQRFDSAKTFLESWKPVLFVHKEVEGSLYDRMGDMTHLTPIEQSFQNYWLQHLQHYLKRLYYYQGFKQHTKLEEEIEYWEGIFQHKKRSIMEQKVVATKRVKINHPY